MDIQNKNSLTAIERKSMVTKGETEGRRDKLGVRDQRIQTTIHKIDYQQRFTEKQKQPNHMTVLNSDP